MRQNGPVSDLIDTTEMYLRTIYELVEEGIVPLRARIAERLHQSGPTVSQTVARMERDGLLTVEGDRHLELTAEGLRLATRVMRKHRLAERLLTDVIGLDWDPRARRGLPLGARDVGERRAPPRSTCSATPPSRPTATRSRGSTSWARSSARTSWTASSRCRRRSGDVQSRVRVRRISEETQKDEELMTALRRVGALPDKVIEVNRTAAGVLIGSGGESAEIDDEAAEHIFVRRM